MDAIMPPATVVPTECHHAENECQRRHQSRPQPDACGFDRRIGNRHPARAQLLRELDDENAVLRGVDDVGGRRLVIVCALSATSRRRGLRVYHRRARGHWAEKLSIAGQLNASLLLNRLIGSATPAGIKAGTDPTDVGAGMVQAPQS